MNVLNLLVGLNSVILVFVVVNVFKPFIGSYAAKKGENLATKQDIAQLTKIAEGIRAEISDKVWDRQKQWELRRDVVIDTIRAHADLDGYMSELATMYSIPLDIFSTDDQMKHKTKLNEVSQEWRKRADAYQRARNVADIAIHGELSRAASAYFENAAKLSIGIQTRKMQYDRSAQFELAKLSNRLVLAARRELNISESDDPPVINYDALQIETAS